MKLTKSKTGFLMILVIFLAIFNVLAFVAPLQREGSFWVGYGFTMLAMVLSFVASGYAFRGESAQSKFYGLPFVVVLSIYLAIQIVVGIVCMLFSPIPLWISLIVSILLLAWCLVGLIAYDLTKDEVERIDRDIKQKAFYIKSLQADVEGMAAKTDDPLLRKAIRELSEAIRYSDPMSADALAALENKIEAKVAELGEQMDEGDAEAAKTLCTEIQNLFAERNRKCRLMK